MNLAAVRIIISDIDFKIIKPGRFSLKKSVFLPFCRNSNSADLIILKKMHESGFGKKIAYSAKP